MMKPDYMPQKRQWDGPILTKMEGRVDHQLELQKVHIRNSYQQESLMASSDPDVIKIHLQ